MYETKLIPNLSCGRDLIGEVLYGKWKIRLLWFIDQGHNHAKHGICRIRVVHSGKPATNVVAVLRGLPEGTPVVRRGRRLDAVQALRSRGNGF